ncbi:leucyl aminopeptidase [Shouchella shacheensis]|uniref:leucyl aminopeptidase n=1 Tax=Shouchella shacheensis TaxID=1649580 RepID=UPI00073FB7A0|nr:leucyl aminopeptidase [Shouchella shacheensis]
MFKWSKEWQASAENDALIVGLWKKQSFEGLSNALDEALAGGLSTLKENQQLPTKEGEWTSFFSLGHVNTSEIYVVYLGDGKEFDVHELREAAGKLGLALKGKKVRSVGIFLDSFTGDEVDLSEAAFTWGEAIAMTTYEKLDYKEKKNETRKSLQEVHFYAEEGAESLTSDAGSGYTYGKGTNAARRLVNIPGNMMTPTDLAHEASELAATYNFELDILERADMERLGMGALLGVAEGSDQPPKMIVLRYQGKKTWEDVTALVGKGLTFDSGGYSLKPGANMHEMKGDMGGSAAVLGAMAIIGEEKPAANVLAVIPSSENLINGSAMKPGDVLRSLSGKTIEVRNTDAEGRLILADGITYAKQLGAERIIDVATLTGACVVALGHETTGAVSNNDALMADVSVASEKTGEPVWRFPTGKAYEKLVRSSDVADLNNAPGRPAGSITAGLFLAAFAEDTPWVHLDIAGTSWLNKSTNLGPAGATGVMARTLARYACGLEK